MRARYATCVDRDHNALRAVIVGGSSHEIWVGNCRAVDRHLVRTGIQQPLDVTDLPHAATNGQRDEHLRSDRFDDWQNQVTPVTGCGDVQKGQLVGALLVVAPGNLDGITGVSEFDKVDSFDHSACGDIKARNDTSCQPAGELGLQHGRHGDNSSARCWAAWKSSVPS